jgi:hypothetical protein
MSIRGISLGVAMLLLGGIGVVRGGEVEATPVCRPYGPTTTYYADPCCQVGPVRRFLRRVFRPCCPPPCARYAPVPVVIPCPPPCLPPAPTGWVPPGAPVRLAPPIAPQATLPPPPIDVPSSLKRDALPPPPPVRFDRIASQRGDEGGARAKAETGRLVTLVQVGKPDSRKQAETDETGRFSVELTPGTWVVYVKDAAGKSVEQGRLVIREQKVVRVRIAESG